MPTPIKFVSRRVKADYNISMSWDFEAKLSDLRPDGTMVEQEKVGSVPFRGDWSLSIQNKDDELELIIGHGERAYAAFGERATVSGELAHFADGTLRGIMAGRWVSRVPQPGRGERGTTCMGYRFPLPEGESAEQDLLPLAVRNSLQRYRFTFTLTQEPDEDVARLYRTPVPDSKRALQLASALTSP